LIPAVSLLALATAAPALAQTAPSAAPATAQDAQPAADEPAPDETNEIVVVATRLRGQVETASPPVVELDEAAVASYGASSIADLVAQLAPEIGTGRGRGGRPVFLVNGQRISNFREMSHYPPEAIRKVEVLPEEVALKYGYPADQRVINFILKDNFVSREVQAEYGLPTAGGYGVGELEGSMLRISGANRLNGSIDYKNTTPLTEAERGIVQTPGSVPTVATDPDPAAYRSLVAKDSSIEANVTSTQGLGDTPGSGQFTINGQVIHDVSRSLSGLDTVVLSNGTDSAVRVLDADPITRRSQTDTYSLGSVLNLPLGSWQFSTTLDASRTDSDTQIDRRRDTSALVDAAAAGALAIDGPLPAVSDAGFDRARSRVYAASSKTTLIGNPIHLPAGDVGVTLDAGFDWTRISSTDTRTALGDTRLTRGDLNAGANVSVPLTSRRNDFLAAVGDLTLNLAGGIDHLSDFGALTNYTMGLVWKPTDRLSLQGSYIVREAAPGLSQLGGPTIVNYNVPTYDFRTGRTVLVTTTSGGNPDLVAEKQRDLKLSANYDLKLFDRANFLVEYYRNLSDNVTASFPLLTTAIEAAFPDRVTRSANGTLTAIDARPVTFARTSSDRIRYGFNLFGKLGKAQAQSEGGGGGGGRFGLSAVAPPEPPAGGSAAGTRGAFDPARFAEIRTKFCATPADQTPDLSVLPERMQERLKGDDGQIDPAKVAAMRQRFCSADGSAATRFDPQRFAAMRAALACDDADKAPDLAALPQQVLDRLKGPDGQIDPARLTEFKTRVCAIQAPPNGVGQTRGQGAGGGDRAAAASGGGGSRGGPGGFGRGGGDGRGRWNLSLYHTINLSNSVLVAPGGPRLDLLDGDATGSGGGVSRHQFELEGGVFYKGIGARLSANYTSATTVNGSGLPGSSDLHFGDLATFNLRIFANLEQQHWLTGDTPGFWKGARLSLRVNNLFDAHQRVTDANGLVPLRYQPGLIDPTGRFVELEFRKTF
jgi:hypothetical protein